MSVLLRSNIGIGSDNIGGDTGNGFPVGMAIITKYAGTSEYVELKWTDPDDTVLDAIVFATWSGTLIVRKKDSAPINQEDGEIVIDNKTRNAYSINSFMDTNIEPDSIYYYRFFTYTDKGVYNSDFSGIVKVETPYFNEIFGDNTFKQIHNAISQNIHTDLWSIGDTIRIYFNEVTGLSIPDDSFSTPSGYIEFMIADFNKNVGYKDSTISNTTDNLFGARSMAYDREDQPRNIILVQNKVSDVITFESVGIYDNDYWMYPYENTYLEEFLTNCKDHLRDINTEQLEEYFYDIDVYAYYTGNLHNLGGVGNSIMRDKFFRVTDEILRGSGTTQAMTSPLVAFPDPSSRIYKKENGELVRFFSFDIAYDDTNNTVYNQHGGTMSIAYISETDYGRIWCALK